MSDWDVKMALLEQSVDNLTSRLDKVETKIDDLGIQMTAHQAGLTKVIIGAAGTVTAGLLSTIVVILMN